MNDTQKTAKGFTDEEKDAMRERAKELKAARRGAADAAEGDAAVRAKIAEMPEPDVPLASGSMP